MIIQHFPFLFGAVLLLITDGEATPCEKGWISFQASCYLFKDETENWASAEYICSALEGKLVEIESSVENRFVKSQIDHRHRNHTFDNVNYWIGGTDLEVEGSFLWIKTRAPFTFSDWHASQPNGGSEDCVAFNCNTDSTIQWHDFTCNHMFYYICEKELSDGDLINIVG